MTRHSQADAHRRLVRQQHVTRVHALGARVLFELLDELTRHHDIGADRPAPARYAALDARVIHAAGGDRFAPAPLRSVSNP